MRTKTESARSRAPPIRQATEARTRSERPASTRTAGIPPATSFTGHITKSVEPQGQVTYSDGLTYTLIISAVLGVRIALYDQLEGTIWKRFVLR